METRMMVMNKRMPEVQNVRPANRFAVNEARARVIAIARELESAFDEDYGWTHTCDAEVECEHDGECPKCGTKFHVEGKQKCGEDHDIEFVLDEQKVPKLRELRLALVALDVLGG